MVAYAFNPDTHEAEKGGLKSEASLSKSIRPYLKNKLNKVKAKGLGSAQVVECLPSKQTQGPEFNPLPLPL
jgi:hypothetical protein